MLFASVSAALNAVFPCFRGKKISASLKIVTNRKIEKEFEFTQNANSMSADEDIFDDVRLLLASIRFGENYTQHSTIYSAQMFLSAWIRNGEVADDEDMEDSENEE